MAQGLVMVEIDDRTLDFDRMREQLGAVQLGPMGAKQVVLSVTGFGPGTLALIQIGSDDLNGLGKAILEFAKFPNAVSVIPVKISPAGN